MTEIEAKKIGSSKGLLCVVLAIILAYIMSILISLKEGFPNSFFWLEEIPFKLNLFVGLTIMLLSGYYFGRLAGTAILIRKNNFILMGLLGGTAILFTTAFLSG